MKFDVSEAVAVICLTILITLCAGEPDLLDAIVDRVSGKYEYQQLSLKENKQ